MGDKTWCVAERMRQKLRSMERRGIRDRKIEREMTPGER